MQPTWHRSKTVRVIHSEDDVPNIITGSLLPPSQRRGARPPAAAFPHMEAVQFTPAHVRRREQRRYQVQISVVSLVCFLLVFAGGFMAANTFQEEQVVAAPIVSLTDRAGESQVIEVGPNELFTKSSFFQETKDAFLAQSATFIEANLSTMELVYIEEGEEVLRVPIMSKGREGSWWQTPAGLYEVQTKKEQHFSSFGDVNLPYSMPFQGNFFIHGWPEYLDGTPVPEGYSGGCIRLSTEDAATLYEQVVTGTPVLVFEERFTGDDFVYEASLPEITAEEYLLADIENNTVLAASSLQNSHAIASLTKLMTALVAAEHINLDTRVRLQQEKYVRTLIPRLEGNVTASMYSLLQLLLVESSNEAAEVIASQLGRERFINEMNNKATAIGLTHTTFADPSGLDEDNVSTVGDLFTLMQYIHHNRRFILELTANQNLHTAYTSGEFGELTNFNRSSSTPSFIGGKVGETLAAGQTVAALHQFSVNGVTRTLVAVILGSDDQKRDTKLLLKYAKDRYGAEELLWGDVGR